MSVITLLSDWNNSDFYIGAVKGRILRTNSDIKNVDISHSVSPFNSSQAAFIIRNTYPNFPPGTVHLIFVNTESTRDTPFLAVKAGDQFFIGTDNGIFSLILGDKAEQIIRLNVKNPSSYTAIELFTSVACKIAEGIPLEKLGEKVAAFNQRIPLRPTIENLTLTGSVIYIDSYQNAIINITRELFDRIRQKRNFEIFVQSKHYRITKISEFYSDVPVGEMLALFNSVGLLEVAINNGNAAGLLNLEINSTVRVVFDANKN